MEQLIIVAGSPICSLVREAFEEKCYRYTVEDGELKERIVGVPQTGVSPSSLGEMAGINSVERLAVL